MLLDRDARESGLFHVETVRRKLREHFAGTRDHLRDLLWAADLALAHRVFVASRAASWAAP